MNNDLPQFALYYPGSLAPLTWMKNMLLIMDGVALFSSSQSDDPELHFGRRGYRRYGEQEYIWRDLIDHQVVKIIPADSFVDRERAEILATELDKVMTDDQLSALSRDVKNMIGMSPAKLGLGQGVGLAERVFLRLVARGLVEPNMQGYGNYRIHRNLMEVVAIINTQMLVPFGPSRGLNLIPATANRRAYQSLERATFGQASTATRAEVALDDFATLHLDLTEVPVDEIIDFKREMQSHLKGYLLSLNQALVDIELGGPERQEQILALRREAIRLHDDIEEIEGLAHKQWGPTVVSALTVGLSMMAAAWQAHKGDGIGAVLALAVSTAAMIGGFVSPPERNVTACSLLLQARDHLQDEYPTAM